MDFYCAVARLDVELDGFQHGLPEQLQHDEKRREFLKAQDIEELRFWNHQWRKNREGCLLEIWNALQRRTGCVRVMKKVAQQRFVPPDAKIIKFAERTNPSPWPSPRLGGERESDASVGSRLLPELFAAAGFKFQFDAATIKPLIQLANSEWKKQSVPNLN